MTRPLIRSSIDELERAFSQRRTDRGFLSMLERELQHLSVNRARKLHHAVERVLSILAQDIDALDFNVPREHEDHETPIRVEGRNFEKTDIHARTNGDEKRSLTPATHDQPIVSNKASEILSAWIALEVLSPPLFERPEQLAGGNRSAVASLTDSRLPWERGETSRPNCRLYYQIVLGTIRMEKAVSCLIERYGDSRLDFPPSKGSVILAIVIVDKEGRLVESPAVSVSSFSWGVPAALGGSLTDLALWPQVEPDLVRRLEKELLRFGIGKSDDEKRESPLTKNALLSAYELLLRETGLPPELVEAPSFAIRCYEHFKHPNSPQPLLLNSFFLADLELARAHLKDKKAPRNLLSYLGARLPQERIDLLRDQDALEAALAPHMTHLASWARPNRHSLALLQQAAVNLTFSETRSGGLLSVNGAPGTGKTTLLRDILAGVVTDRARAMMGFDDPEAAFKHSTQKLKTGNAWLHLYRVDASLRGFEMVVASSNNKAVENVSREMPAMSAIASDEDDLRYFKVLSDEIHGRDTWGLVAAVLGNSANRWNFKDAFWWNDDVGLNAYLSRAAGGNPQVMKTNAATGEVEYAIPKIVAEEKPPQDQRDALDRWNTARKRFAAALEKSQKWQTWLESVRQDMLNFDALKDAEQSSQSARDLSRARMETSATSFQDAKERVTVSKAHLAQSESELIAHRTSRPGLWSRLWATAKARDWARIHRALLLELDHARNRSSNETQQCDTAEELFQSDSRAHEQAESTYDAACEARAAADSRLTEACEKCGVVLPDASFFAQEHRTKQQTTLWYPTDAKRARDDLFIAAMHLHRAFIDAAAKPLRSNLGALMNVFSGNALPSKEKEVLLPDLWATLFLVVPLVSTTFASVGRMLGKLPPKALGWLLIDEAGQAVPQAAVGAIIRSERVVVVGDPAQIEPVVALPDALTHAIALSFGIDPDLYAAPAASVQTLADAASSFSTEFQTKLGSRTVGVPLLVHRRCAEPMFSISNAIAYSGLMVQAKTPNASAIRETLGRSRWIHVEGTGEDKWSDEEGAEVIHLLRTLAEAQVVPDLYIVTPFVIVAERLRALIRESGVLRDVIDSDEIWKWVAERVGTVHTVQGREAEAVILVLGAPKETQTGARGWAGGRPNLLNVAVTRAKEVLYVIGNRKLWRKAGHFGVLDAHLR